MAPTVHCDRARFDPDRSFLSATQNFRFSFFLQIWSRAGQKEYRIAAAAAVSYIYNCNLMDYKHRFRFFCCPHCVRLTLQCPSVRPLCCAGPIATNTGSFVSPSHTRSHSFSTACSPSPSSPPPCPSPSSSYAYTWRSFICARV